MAKPGEGDPRWIVEDRPDAVNVNNWHWSERDATQWSRKRLKELLENIAVDGPEGEARTSDVTVTGEAVANNRKAKLIFLYELVVDIKWKGKTKLADHVTGNINVPNLSEENSIDEVDIDVTMSSSSNPANNGVKSLVVTKIAPMVRAQLHKWYKELREEFTKGMILPTKDTSSDAAPAAQAGVKIHSQKVPTAATNGSGALSTTTVQVNDQFLCSPQDLFDALLNQDKVRAYTQSEAKIDCKLGGTFSLFGGNVTGTITDLVPYERICQAWRFSSWPAGHFSHVTIKIVPGDGKTFVELVQTDVPVHDAERTKQGWHAMQFERLKNLFGYGSSLAGFV